MVKKNVGVKIHPNSSKEEIKRINDGSFEVWLKEKAEKNKANMKLIKLLKKYFKKSVKIKSGANSRNKIVEVIEK